MASAASDGHLPFYPAAPPVSTLLDDHHHHQLYLDPAAAASSFPAAADAQEPQPSAPPAAAEQPRKPRKRARASRRAPTTVVTTDASNFRAMVQEFTGFPAPPPFHLGAGLLVGAGPSPSGSAAAAPFHHQLLRPSPLKLSSGTTSSTSSFSHSLFANNSNANPAVAAVAAPGLSSELYGRFGAPVFASGGVTSYGQGFAAAMGGERAEHGHGLATSFLHAGDRYHSH